MRNPRFIFFAIQIVAIIIGGYYFYQTQTIIRNADLEAIIKQNNATYQGMEMTRKNIKKMADDLRKNVRNQGNHPKDVAILRQAETIESYADSVFNKIDPLKILPENVKINSIVNLGAEKMSVLEACNTNFPNFIATQDTSLQELNKDIRPFQYSNRNCFPLTEKELLIFQYRMMRLERLGVDRITGHFGCGLNILYPSIFVMTAPQSQVVEVGKTYEALMFLAKYNYAMRTKMEISEGRVSLRNDNIGEIEIANVSATNFDKYGKAIKTLTGKITVPNRNGFDTTYTVSTTYTVIKK